MRRRATSSYLFLTLSVVLTIVVLIFMFPCGAPCAGSYSSPRGLHQHRRSCKIYQATQRTLLETGFSHALALPTKQPRLILDALNPAPPDPPALSIGDSSQPSFSDEPFAAHPPVPPATQTSVEGRSLETASNEPLAPRKRRLPLRYRDQLPEPLVSAHAPPALTIRRVFLHVFDSFRTHFNAFGIARRYRHRPSHDPDSFIPSGELSSTPQPSVPFARPDDHPPPWPWVNMSIWRLMVWMLTGSHVKSAFEVTRLVKDVLRAPDFSPNDLEGFDAQTQVTQFDSARMKLPSSDPIAQDKWKRTSVEIVVPTREKTQAGKFGQPFTIDGLYYRPIMDVIRSVFAERSSRTFHLTPFQKVWKSPNTSQERRVYDELYTSDAWNEAQDEIMKQRRTDGCKLERVIAGLMLWSDSTRLAQFGHASAWPIYLFFGNASKYTRTTPEGGACHPIAFIPSLPESLQKLISSISPKKRNKDLLAHCKRELVHAVWRILLDASFVDAYQNGVKIRCFDGVIRRVYPRIFTYSADYPEKVLLATIRDKGICACPRCLVPKDNFYRLGLVNDIAARLTRAREFCMPAILKARRFIYELGKPLKSLLVEKLLKDKSLVPTVNAFMEQLSAVGFNIHSSLTVDLLHEFELGIWKTTLKHLIRILDAISPLRVNVFNERFTHVPPFGRAGIRCFPAAVAETSLRPAWYFEDVLQCAMPVFESLFPPGHDGCIQTLLFRLAEWHALAKLRLHTEDTLVRLSRVLRQMGDQLRKFKKKTCSEFNTSELPQEATRRQKREVAGIEAGSRKQPSRSGRLPVAFNLNTYKVHALGDYEMMIRLYGTTDSYNTQVGERAHRLIKKYYSQSNKKNIEDQFAKQERRDTFLRRQLEATTADIEAVKTFPDVHHSMASTAHKDNLVNLIQFLQEYRDDPAVKANFMQMLKDHLLVRLLGLEYGGDERPFTEAQHQMLRLTNLGGIIESKLFRVNYTTYDMRRDYDTIRCGKGGVVMTLSKDEGHSFLYARVIRAFTMPVLFAADGLNFVEERIEVLWVRWLDIDPHHRWGFKEARLPKVGFVPDQAGQQPFGFLDPSLVIRACHLIPAFVDKRTDRLLRPGTSLARLQGETDDWKSFYVNIFADRDMFARFAGIGVGHLAMLSDRRVPAMGVDLGDDMDESDDEQNEEEWDADGRTVDLTYDETRATQPLEGEEDMDVEGEDEMSAKEDELEVEDGGDEDDENSSAIVSDEEEEEEYQ